MPKRKQVEVVLKSVDEVDSALAEMCRITSRKARLEGEMNALLTAAREKFQSDLDECQADYAGQAALVEQWAEANRVKFLERRTMELTHGEIGFRTSPPAVVLVSRKWSWPTVVGALRALGRRFGDCVRLKEEVNKDVVLAAYAAKEFSDADLQQVGLAVVQRETFGIELKYEEAEAPAPATVEATADERR